MVQLLNNWVQYSQICKKAEVEHHCTDKPPYQGYNSIFYILDYKNKDELADFGGVIADTLGSLFVTERIGGGIGILEIEQSQSDLDIELLLRRLLIASERAVSIFEKDFEICFYNEELEAMVDREIDIVESLNAIVADDDRDNDLFCSISYYGFETGSIWSCEALSS